MHIGTVLNFVGIDNLDDEKIFFVYIIHPHGDFEAHAYKSEKVSFSLKTSKLFFIAVNF
jgi:hypothetical protein